MTESSPEDRLTIPDEWLDLVLPRPSNRFRYEVDLDPEAAERFRREIDESREGLTAAVRPAEVAPDLAGAVLDYLDGEATPLGLSVVSELLRFGNRRGLFRDQMETVDRREQFEAWTLLHGLPFAVSAFLEGLDHGILWDRSGAERTADFPFAIREEQQGDWVRWMRPGGPMVLIRALIANVDEEAYERIVEAAEASRRTACQRRAAAFLLPDELDWVAEACDDFKTKIAGVIPLEGPWRFVGSVDHVKRLGEKKINPAYLNEGTVPELVTSLGVDAFPVLAETLKYKTLGSRQRSGLFDGIARIPTDEAMAFLLDRISAPQVNEGLELAATLFPLRAARLTAPCVTGYSAAERSKLAGVLRPVVDSAVLNLLEPAEREAIIGLLSDGAMQEVNADCMPWMLTCPPWHEDRKIAAPLKGLKPPSEVVLKWDPVEYERAMAIRPSFREWDEVAYWESVVGEVMNRSALELESVVFTELARGGAEVADAVVEKIARKPSYGAALVPVRSAKAAHRAADWLVRLKSGRVHAIAWLDRHGADAAPLLVPAALGGDKKTRPAAEAALRYTGRVAGDASVLEAVAAHYDAAVVQRVEELLDTEPEVPLGSNPKPGAWADARLLPPVKVKDGSAVLPREGVVNLIPILSLWSPRLPYPGVETVREYCDAASLERFSIALFELWLSAGAPPDDSWAVDQLGCFGTDTTVALLDGHINDWAGHNHVERARLGLAVLTAIGTDAAFEVMYRFANLGKYPTTTELARAQADRLAAARGTDAETLADRLIPDLGITDPAVLVFDYGSRAFHLAFDERLNPRLTDPAGRERKALPSPGVRDDKATANASRRRYKRLLEDLERLVRLQEIRLETAMMERRARTVADFHRMTAHPVMSTLARRLVWAADDGRTVRGFRIAEDGSLSDVDERHFELPEGTRVLVAHPALIPTEVAAWIQILDDYAILQPFAQMTRPALALTDEEHATGRLQRFEGCTVRLGALADAVPIIREFRTPDDHEYVHTLRRAVPGGYLLVDVDPPVTDFSPDPDGSHRLVSVHFATTANRHPDYAEALPGKAIDPVIAAELLGALTAATRPDPLESRA